MKINRRLNLVVPVELEQGDAYVHSTPVSRETFDQFYLLLAKVFARIFGDGLGIVSGPRVAYKLLKDVAGADGWKAVHDGLIQEFVRLSNVAIAGEGGWQQVPLYVVKRDKLIGEPEFEDLLGEILFFTCIWHLNKPAMAQEMLTAAAGLWGWQLSSSDFTAFVSSLQTSTPAESGGETASTSSASTSSESPAQAGTSLQSLPT